MRAVLAAIDSARRNPFGQAAACTLADWLRPKPPGLALLTASLDEEAPTAPLHDALVVLGWRAAYPRIAFRQPPKLTWHVVLDRADLAPDDHKIPCPAPDTPSVDPMDASLVIVPGLAFDRAGYRLGRGGGFFDALLSELPESCGSVGYCWPEQFVSAVPRDCHDRAVQSILTTSRLSVVNENLS